MRGRRRAAAGNRPVILMRVLHVSKVKGIGGSERHLLDLLSGLSRRGADVRMVVLASPGAKPFEIALERRGLSTVILTAGRDMNPQLVAALRSQIKVFRPDLVHTHLIHADTHGQLAAATLRVPGVSTVHSAHEFYRREPYRMASRLVGRRARRVIALSQYCADYLVRNRIVPSAKLRIIPYGVDVGDWRVTGEERQAARARFGVPADAFVAGIASRMIPGKGHDLALEAAWRLHGDMPGFRLLLAGDGELRDQLELDAAAVPGGVVRILGFVDDVRAFMAACDCLLFLTEPRLGEGFGLAALEAMAAGLPVVATQVASLPEIVGPEAGVLVPPGSVEAIDSALRRLASDAALRAAMGRLAAIRATACFDRRSMIERTIHVYQEIVE